MRDIRADLAERRDALLQEAQKLEEQAKAMRASVPQLDALIEAETLRWANGNTHQKVLFEDSKPTDINSFITGLLNDGRPRTTAQIRDSAVDHGIKFDGVSPGRSINFRLVGLKRYGQVKYNVADGTWSK